MTTRTAKTYRLRIHRDLCKNCRLCVEFCPKGVLAMTTDRLNVKGVPYAECVHPDRCIGCQACVLICPDAVIELYEIREDEDGLRPRRPGAC